jgi:hypothetical protein
LTPDWFDCGLAALNIVWRQNDFSVTQVVLWWLRSFQLPIRSRSAMQMRRTVTLRIRSAKFVNASDKIPLKDDAARNWYDSLQPASPDREGDVAD